MKKEIVIIGGGVIGLNCAYYLSEEGHQVTIIDKNDPSSNLNCSIGNMGMIVPSHFVPLAAPGIIGQGLKWLLNPRSPFYIRPQVNKDTISWMYKFWKAANEKQVNASIPSIKAYNSLSLDLYKEIHADKKFDFFFKEDGLLLLCKTEKTLEEEIHLSKTANALGLKTQTLDKEGLKKLEPNIDINVTGGVLYNGDAHISPNEFISNMHQYLSTKSNVKFVSNSELEHIEKQGSEIKSIRLKNGQSISGDEFILAAGSFSGKLVKQLGVTLPMMGGKGYTLTVHQQEQKLRTPSILCEARVAVTPWDGLIRFGGTMELGGREYETNPLRIEGIINSINNYFPKYDCLSLQNATPWSGLRPCPPDGLPYIGRFKKTTNLVAATGHSMMGLSLGPATGKIITSIVSNTTPDINIEIFNPDRYN
jgi:D-amino-acid dehydrogenase